MTDWRIRIEPALRPVFRTWWRLRRGMTLGVRAVVCDESARVLLVRHTYTSGWHLPGGGVEDGETAEQALRRELAEEGGVESTAAAQLFGVYSNHANFANDHILIYRIDRWQACQAGGGGEIAERGFYARAALPEDVAPGARRRLAEMFDGAPQSPLW